MAQGYEWHRLWTKSWGCLSKFHGLSSCHNVQTFFNFFTQNRTFIALTFCRTCCSNGCRRIGWLQPKTSYHNRNKYQMNCQLSNLWQFQDHRVDTLSFVCQARFACNLCAHKWNEPGIQLSIAFPCIQDCSRVKTWHTPHCCLRTSQTFPAQILQWCEVHPDKWYKKHGCRRSTCQTGWELFIFYWQF